MLEHKKRRPWPSVIGLKIVLRLNLRKYSRLNIILCGLLLKCVILHIHFCMSFQRDRSPTDTRWPVPSRGSTATKLTRTRATSPEATIKLPIDKHISSYRTAYLGFFRHQDTVTFYSNPLTGYSMIS